MERGSLMTKASGRSSSRESLAGGPSSGCVGVAGGFTGSFCLDFLTLHTGTPTFWKFASRHLTFPRDGTRT